MNDAFDDELDEEHELLLRRVREMTDIIDGPAGVAEAELFAHGLHPVTVVHGRAVTAEEIRLIYNDLHVLAEECGTLRCGQGSKTYTTFVYAGDDPAAGAAEFMARAAELGPPTWVITPTARPEQRE